VIGLLASTGLRIGEAIRLTTGDVHLDHTPPVLHIRETKFHKSRYVPLHPTTAAQLCRYLALRTALRYDAFSDVCFVSEQGQALTHRAIGAWFAQLCRRLGLWHTDGGRRPSLHALRHYLPFLTMSGNVKDFTDMPGSRSRRPSLGLRTRHSFSRSEGRVPVACG
jgi:integrase/recombinase XerD